MPDGAGSNVNVGSGSKTVDPFSPPRRANNPNSDRGEESGLASPIARNESGTKGEIPRSKLALALSPSPLHFSDLGEGDIVREGGTRSASRDHVRIHDPPRIPSRYARSSRVGNSFTSRSHSGLSSTRVVMDVADAMDRVNTRIADRAQGGFREVSDEEQRAEFKLSLTNHTKERQECIRKTPETAALGVDYLRNLPRAGSFLSYSDIRSCSPTVDSPSTEVLSGSRFYATRCDSDDTSSALRWRLRSDGRNNTVAGKRVGHGNEPGGVGVMDSYKKTRRLSAVTSDNLADCGNGLYWVDSRVNVSQDPDSQSSRCSPRSHYLGRSSNPGYVPRYPPTNGRVMGGTSPLGPHSDPRTSRQLQPIVCTDDAGDIDKNAPWYTWAQEHPHSNTQKCDALRFSSSSPLTTPRHLNLDQDEPDDDKDSVFEDSGQGFDGNLTLDGKLQGNMKVDMMPHLNTRTRLNGSANGAVLGRGSLPRPLTGRLINTRDDRDGSELRLVDGIERWDMGGLERGRLGLSDLRGRALPISGSVFVAGGPWGFCG